jgi:stalled ribosome rescue protein Dom34
MTPDTRVLHRGGLNGTQHVAVWIDHKEARIFHIAAEKNDEVSVTVPLHHLHRKHPRGAEGVKEHPEDTKRFFHEVVGALESAEELLIVGPSTAKLDLIRYIHQHAHALEPRVVGIETVDHPSDGQLVAYARTYFKRIDGTRPSSAE